MRKVFLCFIVSVGVSGAVFAQADKNRWVDSVFNALSVNERIGQMFMLTLSSKDEVSAAKEIENEIESHKIGGIIFTQGSPVKQAKLTNRFQRSTETPLLIAQDAEWGLGMSLDSTVQFPRALVLGAIRNEELVYTLGSEVARQMKSMGVHINFAPVADVNNNPQNPIISYRSYGENMLNVASKAVAFSKGMQDNGVLACAKHFPIKGLTIMDVQKGVPVIQMNVDSIQSYPYQKLFENNVSGVLLAPADFPMFYGNKSLIRKNQFNSSKLSSLFTGDWLRKKFNYGGLVFVDIQNTRSIIEKNRAGEAETFAFQAGNDVLMNPKDLGAAIRKIKKLIQRDKKYEEQLATSVKKILAAKYDAGLTRKQSINTDNLVARLNSASANVLNQKLYESALTVIRNDHNVLPLTAFEGKHVAYITSDGTAPNNEFYHYLSKYRDVAYFTVDVKTDWVELTDALNDQEIIIVGVFPQTPQAVIEKLHRALKQLQPNREIIACDFGNETFLKSAAEYPTLLTAYVNNNETLKLVPQLIFGGLGANGTLPFTASSFCKEGMGVEIKSINRLSYSLPEDVGMDGKVLQKIEAIAREAIGTKATPGCNVLVARNGKVIYEKSFGYLDYKTTTPVTDESIYDLASLTKVSATLQAVMFMHERGLIDIHKKISVYLPELLNTNKKDITIYDILIHQAGLTPFVPMWPSTMLEKQFSPVYYGHAQTDQYSLQVSPSLFASPVIQDSIWLWIGKSKMIDKPVRTAYPYRYSDLGFMMLKQLAEKMLNQPIADFLQQNLYEPLGASTTGFLPLLHFPKERIAPTELDTIFRKSLVLGTVHDERAAMMGGISGHAGLFSSGSDLLKLGQMLLQEGSYGGMRYYKPETVRLFADRQFEKGRRGLGWDKPVQGDWNSPTSQRASHRTFGHTGFTGTCLWVDPEFNLVYIFVSNRVFPDRSNKLNQVNIRSRIQDVIYESIFEYCKSGEQPLVKQ
jgi:beta-N-acetylhexosaminidase